MGAAPLLTGTYSQIFAVARKLVIARFDDEVGAANRASRPERNVLAENHRLAPVDLAKHMVAMANTVMRGGVNTVTSTPTSPTDTTASRTSVVSSTVTVYSAGPSFRAFEKSDRRVVEQGVPEAQFGEHEQELRRA